MPKRGSNRARNSGGGEVWGNSETISVLVPIETASAGAEPMLARLKLTAKDLFDRANTKGGMKPATLQVLSIMVNIATSSSYATQGNMSYYWTNDNDQFSGNDVWDDIKNAVARTNDNRGNNRRGMTCTVNKYPYDSRPRILIDDNKQTKFRNSSTGAMNETSVIGCFAMVFPRGVEPLIYLIVKCKWGGLNTVHSGTPAMAPARGVLYPPEQLNTTFLNESFAALAKEFAYKSSTNPKKIHWARALQIVFYKTVGESAEPVKLCVVGAIDSLTYSPNFSFMFPAVLEDATMLSKPTRWTQAAISSAVLDDEEVWYAHSENFETDLPELDISGAYTRVTSLGPNERTPSEILSAVTNGNLSVNVAGNSRSPLATMFAAVTSLDKICAAVEENELAGLLLLLDRTLRDDFTTVVDAVNNEIFTKGSAKANRFNAMAKALVNFFENQDDETLEQLFLLSKQPLKEFK